MPGLFVAAAVVALVQFWRLRDRRLAPIAVMFAMLAGAESREDWEPWHRRYQLGALAAGLTVVALLSIEDDALARRIRGGGRV
jgi:hypothetical protein